MNNSDTLRIDMASSASSGVTRCPGVSISGRFAPNASRNLVNNGKCWLEGRRLKLDRPGRKPTLCAPSNALRIRKESHGTLDLPTPGPMALPLHAIDLYNVRRCTL